MKNGYGSLTLKDGRMFEGDFEDGMANGYGVLVDGEKELAGIWTNNELKNFL